MRKSKIFVIVSGFIIVTCILFNFNKQVVYSKQKVFTNVDDIVDVLDNKVLNIVTDYNSFEPLEEFSECLSYRKRVVGAGLDYSYLDLSENKNKNTNEIKKKILSNYYAGLKNIGIKKKPDVVDVKVFDCKGYYNSHYMDDDNKFTLEVVFIKEDDGIVIDYFETASFDYEEFKSEFDE